jgi:hypothetical protein
MREDKPIMPAMKMGVSAVSGSEVGLPKVSYFPPIVATLLAALFIFAIATALGLVMLGNTLNQIEHAGSDESGTSLLSAGLCGILSLIFLGISLYLMTAIVKGIRDLGTPLQYTRGTVVEQQVLASRRMRNWLLVNPAYSGPDQERARRVTDEQIAASVDRGEIVQTRSGGGFWRSRRGQVPAARKLEEDLARTNSQAGSYLSPERISASQATLPTPDASDTGDADSGPKPHVFFRSDFASQAQLRAGEEVIVAHSRYLEHPYYVARLMNGEWQVHRNKALL